MKDCILKTEKNMESIINLHTFFCENITEYYHNVLETYYQSNRITNLMLLIFWTGGRFNIRDFDDLVKYKVIALKEFDLKYREFRLLFYSRNKKRKYLGLNNNDIKLSKISKDSDLLNKFSENNNEFDSDFYDFEDFEYDEEDEIENDTNIMEKSSNGGEFSSFQNGNY